MTVWLNSYIHYNRWMVTWRVWEESCTLQWEDDHVEVVGGNLHHGSEFVLWEVNWDVGRFTIICHHHHVGSCLSATTSVAESTLFFQSFFTLSSGLFSSGGVFAFLRGAFSPCLCQNIESMIRM